MTVAILHARLWLSFGCTETVVGRSSLTVSEIFAIAFCAESSHVVKTPVSVIAGPAADTFVKTARYSSLCSKACFKECSYDEE